MIWYVLASGPSLTQADIERVRLEHEAGRAVVAAVNTTIFSAPWADICYAWDHKWWSRYHAEVKKLGCRMISAASNTKKYGIEIVGREPNCDGMGKNGGLGGNNSGAQCINYAALHTNEVVVLGFDCTHVEGKAHHHDDHPKPLSNAPNTHKWRQPAVKLAQDLKKRGIRVTNCSPKTALTCFPVMTLEGYLATDDDCEAAQYIS